MSDYAKQIALFMDVENFYISSRNLNLHATVTPIIERLKEEGRIGLRRSFGDLEKIIPDFRFRSEFRKDLHKNLFIHEDTPQVFSNRNYSDIRMAIEAVSIAYERPELTTFAILSSDKDFLPCILKLRELGKEIIGIGVSNQFTNRVFAEACDVFIYCDALAGFKRGRPDYGSPQEGYEEGLLLEEYFKLLRRACTVLEDQGEMLSGAAVNKEMQHLRSDFNPRLVSCERFRDFISLAADHRVVEVDLGEGSQDVEILRVLPEEDALPVNRRHAGSGPAQPLPEEPEALAEFYRDVIESKLKIDFPTRHNREALLESLEVAFPETLRTGETISLQEWSESVQLPQPPFPDLTPDQEQNIAYRFLLTLYFARCFLRPPQPYTLNPEISGFLVEPPDWLERVDRQIVHTLNKELGRNALNAEALSLLLHEDGDHDEEVSKLIEFVQENDE